VASVGVPVFSVSHFLGYSLSVSPPSEVHVKAHPAKSNTPTPSIHYTSNIIADAPGGDPDNTIVFGAHLDSVPAGPGINDNGSGAMAILEVAHQFALKMSAPNFPKTRPRIRFCWWGAEEVGMLGSEYYVEHLKKTGELSKVALYLNFDMLGSPNYIRGIFTGANMNDGLTSKLTPDDVALVQSGSTRISELFTDYFTTQKLPFEMEGLSGRTDFESFVRGAIPSGGMDTGADFKKTIEERSKYGGMAQTPHDPCYHSKCDTVDNINTKVLEENTKSIARVLEELTFMPHVRTTLSLQTWLETAVPSNPTVTPSTPARAALVNSSASSPELGDSGNSDEASLFDSVPCIGCEMSKKNSKDSSMDTAKKNTKQLSPDTPKVELQDIGSSTDTPVQALPHHQQEENFHFYQHTQGAQPLRPGRSKVSVKQGAKPLSPGHSKASVNEGAKPPSPGHSKASVKPQEPLKHVGQGIADEGDTMVVPVEKMADCEDEASLDNSDSEPPLS